MSHGLTVVTVARHLRRFFIDDGWAHGPAEAGGQLVQDVGLGPADVAGITAGWRQALAAAQTAIVGAGAFNWQLMANSGTAAKAPFNNCTAFMRQACVPGNSVSGSPLFYGFDRAKDGGLPKFEWDLAAFLMARGDYSWLVSAWHTYIDMHPATCW